MFLDERRIMGRFFRWHRPPKMERDPNDVLVDKNRCW
jgi:hypothetical protein